jgi:hypothetical protein
LWGLPLVIAEPLDERQTVSNGLKQSLVGSEQRATFPLSEHDVNAVVNGNAKPKGKIQNIAQRWILKDAQNPLLDVGLKELQQILRSGLIYSAPAAGNPDGIGYFPQAKLGDEQGFHLTVTEILFYLQCFCRQWFVNQKPLHYHAGVQN